MPYKALASDGTDRRKAKFKKTTKNSSTAPRKVAITAAFKKKADEAVQYRQLGYNYSQIATEMKIDRAYAHRLVKWSMDREPVEGADQLRQLMVDRLEMMLAATLDRAFEGDVEAQDQARRTMDQIAKLLGLNKPAKVELSGELEVSTKVRYLITPEDAKL